MYILISIAGKAQCDAQPFFFLVVGIKFDEGIFHFSPVHI
jgi:hypothetical protein